MPIEDGIEIIIKAFEKQVEYRVYQLYVAQYPYMNEENYKTFEEWYQPRKVNEIENNQSVEEILDDVKTILNNMQRK